MSDMLKKRQDTQISNTSVFILKTNNRIVAQWNGIMCSARTASCCKSVMRILYFQIC